MNVLEKILEEMDEQLRIIKNIPDREDGDFMDGEECYEDGRVQGRYEELVRCKEIIRSHMGEVSDMRGKRLIDANALDEEVMNLSLAITGNPNQATVVRECKESFRRMIDEQPTVYEASDWIPVDERLPEEDERYKGRKVIDVLVTTAKGKVTKVQRQSHNGYWWWGRIYGEPTAWQPLPEPYKGGKE